MENINQKKEIHFILNEKLKNLNEEIKELAFRMNDPLVGEKIYLLKKFTKAMIKAYGDQRKSKITRKPPEDSLIITPTYETERIEIPTREQLAYKIPTFRPPQEQKIEIKKAEKKAEQKQVIKIEPLKEERITLIKSSITGEENAYAIQKGIIYTVNESDLTHEDVTVLNFMKPIIEKKKELFKHKPKFLKLMKKVAKKNKIDSKTLDPHKLRYFLVKHIINYGLIDPLLYDPKITKIICDGPNLKIGIIKDAKELITNLEYRNQKQINLFLEKLAEKTNQKISEEEPTLEVEIKDFKVKATMGTEDIPSRFVIERLL